MAPILNHILTRYFNCNRIKFRIATATGALVDPTNKRLTCVNVTKHTAVKRSTCCRYDTKSYSRCCCSCKIILFIMTYERIFSARIVNIWNSLPNSVVDACTVNAFKARLDKFWRHRLVKFDFTADLTGTGNRSEEVVK